MAIPQLPFGRTGHARTRVIFGGASLSRGTQVAATHRRSLQRFDFDSVLLPYTFLTMQIPYYRENFDGLQATCEDRNVAVQTIKSIACRPWMGRERTSSTWYQPLSDAPDI